MKSEKILTAFILIFVSGLIIGGISGYYICGRKVLENQAERRQLPGSASPELIRERLTGRLKWELDLNAEQIRKVYPILKDFSEKMQVFRKNNLEKASQNFDDLFTQIEAILSENQKGKLAKVRTKMRENFSRGNRPF